MFCAASYFFKPCAFPELSQSDSILSRTETFTFYLTRSFLSLPDYQAASGDERTDPTDSRSAANEKPAEMGGRLPGTTAAPGAPADSSSLWGRAAVCCSAVSWHTSTQQPEASPRGVRFWFWYLTVPRPNDRVTRRYHG